MFIVRPSASVTGVGALCLVNKNFKESERTGVGTGAPGLETAATNAAAAATMPEGLAPSSSSSRSSISSSSPKP